jgi:glycosyltransferase involved in cell wall biosynthesis
MFKLANKIRIVFFLANFNLGGAAESIVKLSEFLSKYGFSVLLISINKNHYKKRLLNAGCDIKEIKVSRVLFSFKELKKIIKLETNKKFTKIIFFSSIHYVNIISIFACMGNKKIKLILTERSSFAELKIKHSLLKNIKSFIIYMLAKFFYKYSDLVITNSNYEKIFIKKNFKLKNIRCIHPPSIKKVQTITKKIKKNKITNIIFVGRISKEKGLDLIIKALSILKNTSNFNFNLKIYGNGNEKNKIISMSKKFKINKKIFFFDFEKNHNKIFKNADLFINSSYFEGLPNALVQALNYDVFSICSDAPGGNLEVIKYGKLGLTFKKGSYFDLADKINLYLKNTYKIQGLKYKKKHLKKYTEINSYSEYIKVIRSI